jgi:hypothetical protein
MEIEILRMVERIIIALGGILSIVLGYKLFYVAELKADSGANFKSAFFSASFTKVGPGVFFALFGAYVMSLAIKTQIDVETSQVKQAVNQPAVLSQIASVIAKLPESAERAQLIGLFHQLDGTANVHSRAVRID